MKSFTLALLAATAEALITTEVGSVPVTASSANSNFATLDSGVIEYGYDATNLYINVTTESTLQAAPTLDTEKYQVGALIKYDATPKQYVIGCNIAWNNTNNQFTPTWIFMDKAADISTIA